MPLVLLSSAERLSSKQFAHSAFGESQQAFAARRRKDECYLDGDSNRLQRVPEFRTSAERDEFVKDRILFSPLYDGVLLLGSTWKFGAARAELFRAGGVTEVLKLLTGDRDLAYLYGATPGAPAKTRAQIEAESEKCRK